MNNLKKIIHIDMDAFFASVEERDNPSLKGKPVIVGGAPDRRGVVATCSYEARKYGIHSAMSSKRAYALCPHAIFIHGNHDKYKEVSRQIRNVFERYTDKVEPLSLDEAFLDVTTNHYNIPYATEIAKRIKIDILQETGLSASAGISYNKFLAKIASDLEKPNGLTVIKPENAQQLLDLLPIEKISGVGQVTARDLRRIGIKTGYDLRQLEVDYLKMMFNKRGQMLYDFARGIDYREVESHRVRKSVGSETTFDEDIYLYSEEMNVVIERLAEEVERRLAKVEKKAKTLTIKIKFDDFEQITRSLTIERTIHQKEELVKYTNQILKRVDTHDKKIRLLGITTHNLLAQGEEVFVNLSLFD